MTSSSGLAPLLRELIAKADEPSMPDATLLREHFAPRAKAVSFSNENLVHPPWATGTQDARAAYVELATGRVIGMQLWDDDRGWGARAEITVENATRAELEEITGPLRALPRQPYRPERLTGDVSTKAGTVVISADHAKGIVSRVLVQFNRPPEPRAVDYDRRILESIARWDAQTKTLENKASAQSAPVAPPPTKTVILAEYTKRAKDLVLAGQRLADERHHRYVTVLHVLTALFCAPDGQELVRATGGDPLLARAACEVELASFPTVKEASYMSQAALVMLDRAKALAAGEHVSLAHLLEACITQPPRVTIEDLDRNGLSNGPEEQLLNRIVAAGSLGRTRPS